jgi:hypothetical protein
MNLLYVGASSKLAFSVKGIEGVLRSSASAGFLRCKRAVNQSQSSRAAAIHVIHFARKVSRKDVYTRTANRHRWTGRAY